jgi:ABC-type transporter Mla MlaB component
MVISGPIVPDHIPGLCRRFRTLVEGSDADLVLCDVSALVEPDAVAVDALARLQLTARSLGREVRLLHTCGELRELLDLMGLSGVLSHFVEVELPLEPGG